MKRARAALRALAVAALAVAGCGGGQTQGLAFDSEIKDDGTAMSELQKHLADVKIPPAADVAVGVFGERSLVGVSLGGGEPWTFEHPIACRPVVAGSIVVGVGANEMFGLDAKTGKLLWTRKAGGCVRGAADDGKVTVVSMRPITGRGGIVLAIARDGQVIRQIEDDSSIGAPSMIDGILFLPWDSRFVSAYDISIGQEVARVRFQVRVTRAFTVGGALFFGERTATRFDDRIGLAPVGHATTLALPSRALPDGPLWMDSGNDSQPAGAVASDRVRLYARPVDAGSGALAIAGGRYAATHGRIVIGLDAKDGSLAWVQAHDAIFLGGAAYEGGFALCDREGRVMAFDAQTGAEAGAVSLGIPVDACVVQADGITRTKAEPSPIFDQIASAIRLHHGDEAPMQRFLLRELATSPAEEATATLIDLVESNAAAEEIAFDVRVALASRRSGVTAMLATLAKRYDFLEGTEPTRALSPLADALAALGEKRAAPLLAEHLVRPETLAADLERIAAALAVLAGPDELPALRFFFAAYRSESVDAAVILAMAHVGRALTRLGSGDIVAAARDDAQTSDAVKAMIAAPPPDGPASSAR